VWWRWKVSFMSTIAFSEITFIAVCGKCLAKIFQTMSSLNIHMVVLELELCSLLLLKLKHTIQIIDPLHSTLFFSFELAVLRTKIHWWMHQLNWAAAGDCRQQLFIEFGHAPATLFLLIKVFWDWISTIILFIFHNGWKNPHRKH